MIDPSVAQANTTPQSTLPAGSVAQRGMIIIDVNPNVSRAERAIEAVSSGLLGIDSESNMRQVANLIIGLTPQETGFLFDRLDNQELADFGRAMLAGDLPGFNYGLNATDRHALFTHLAADLPGAELARVGIGTGDPSNMAKAVSTHAPGTEQVQFVKALAPQVSAETVRSGSITSTQGNGAADAVIEVLGGLSGQDAANAFGSMTRAQLDTVMEVAQGQWGSTQALSGSAIYSTGYTNDAAGVTTLLNAAARIDSSPAGIDQKARAFTLGVEQLGDIRASGAVNAADATNSVLDGLTNILKSDPSAVLTELRGQSAENTGASLATYARTMFVSGRSEELGEVMGLLKSAGGQDLLANFKDPSGDFENARNLGYFSNAITQGLGQVASATGTLARNVDAVGGGILNVVIGSWNPVAGAAADEAVAVITGSLNDGAGSRYGDIGESFRVLAWPVSEKPAGDSQFQDAIDAFNAARTNRP